MNLTRKVSLIVPALALLGLGGVTAPAPVAAQSIFASPMAAHSAGMGSNFAGGSARYSGLQANDTGTGTGTGTSGDGTDPYTAIFAQIQTATSGLLSGPGALAFGILILGLGFGVAWRLVTKGVKSIAK